MNDSTSEAMTGRPQEDLRKTPRLRMIGGTLLALYLPPVFAVAILRRWKSVPQWLRTCSIAFAFLTPAVIAWRFITPQPILEFAMSLCLCLTWTFFALSYMRERRIRASLFLKLGTAFIYLVLLLGIVLFSIHRFWFMPRIRVETCTDAVYRGNTEMVASLLDEGVDVNASDAGHGTLLMYASLKGHNEIIRLLLERGADPNLGGKNDVMPLQLAVRRSHLEATRLLLAADTDVNSRNAHGHTALHYAARTGDMNMLRLLLEHEADPCTKDNDSNTPSDIARSEGHTKAAELIKHALTRPVR